MKNLLIIHQGALGDFVLTAPAILKLKKKFSRTDALCQGKLGNMAVFLNIIDKFFPLEAACFASLYSDSVDPRVKSILNLYHKIIIFSNSEKLEHVINETTGNKSVRIRPRPDIKQKIHVTEYTASNLLRFGLIEKSDYNSILMPSSYTDRRDSLFDPKKIILHPGSGSMKKNWHVSNFVKICDKLKSYQMEPEFVAGPAEHFLIRDIPKNGNQIHIISDLAELVLLLKKAGGFIGNDSGVTHLAAFLGLPTVSVFGPSDPDRWKPAGRAVKIVRPDLDCCPCFETGKNVCDKMECLEKTTPEIVVGEFDKLLL
ncbi:MAG: glycosyltransferase family 9 protein [Desulfobacteraceae bacterium]|nr:glycosyltransferase family 9 protein [Desulfobacteraceae bacterium]